MKEILIVGGGASGLLVAINLARLSQEPLALTIAEPREILGQGVAYSTSDSAHLLNVPAGRMSALVDDPAHFSRYIGCDAGAFISRSEYGRYLLATFLEFQGANPLFSFRHEKVLVESIERLDGHFVVHSDSGAMGKFDAIVLATGHGQSISSTSISRLSGNPRIVLDVWRDLIPQSDGTMISVGTGLTFIDHALTHLRRNPSNRAIGISRTGWLPLPHLKKRAEPLAVPEPARATSDGMRAFIESSSDWRAAQDGVRHELPEIWYRWSEEEKQRFMNRHLRWWNVHRHRVAPEIDEELQEMATSGRLQVISGEIEKIDPTDDGLEVSLTDGRTLESDFLINSMGYRSGEDSQLIQSLVVKGLAELGPLDMGISTDFPSFHVKSAKTGGEGLFAIGALLIGERFETTAVPELKVQAHEISTLLLS